MLIKFCFSLDPHAGHHILELCKVGSAKGGEWDMGGGGGQALLKLCQPCLSHRVMKVTKLSTFEFRT